MRPRLSALIAAAVVAGCVASTPLRESPPGALRLLPADPAVSVLYVALGDSTVEGVGASSPARNYVGQLHERLSAVYPRARVVNLGVGGATASGVLSRQLPRAIKLRPDLVTLSVGPNDITGKRDLESYARDIDAILRILTRQTGAVVVVNLIPDLTVTPRFRGKEIEARVRQRVVAFNEILALQARGYGAEVVDLYTASQREVPARPDLIGPDRYHPSDDGYARWAELMWAGIEARIMREPSRQRPMPSQAGSSFRMANWLPALSTELCEELDTKSCLAKRRMTSYAAITRTSKAKGRPTEIGRADRLR